MRKNLLILCLSLLTLLFIYAAAAKLIDLHRFSIDMHNQPLPYWMASVAVYAIPGIEIVTVLLFVPDKTRLAGIWLAWGLMLLFTIYTSLILGNTFGRIPCSCGGFIRQLSWKQHLLFNLFFLVTSSVALVLETQLSLLKIFHAHETGQTENL